MERALWIALAVSWLGGCGAPCGHGGGLLGSSADYAVLPACPAFPVQGSFEVSSIVDDAGPVGLDDATLTVEGDLAMLEATDAEGNVWLYTWSWTL
jgi:hypothetical protein